jgi:hypothetical protein
MCGYAFAELHLFERLRPLNCGLRKKIVPLDMWICSCESPSFKFRNFDCKHNKKLRMPISVYSFSPGIVQCFCAPGYGGSGVGPLGCLPGGATAPLGPVAPPATGVAVSPCASAPCQNGATCIPTAVSFLCQCPAGYTGQLCSVLSDPCAAGPCQNGGTCRSSGQVGGNYRTYLPYVLGGNIGVETVCGLLWCQHLFEEVLKNLKLFLSNASIGP